ncbi:PKD domain-containing protein [uncultured Lacinutrix sp.]|uniref:PKD domain-containing protein n=1 Tax=uncultured Lacinutrix sp. TaxID=574032 RepID=UPI00260947F3|nr:PKD domain-containing protein [uncultured Lacinutrix sp.]
MKKTLLIIFTIFSLHTNAQDLLMQNGTVNMSSGTFLDSGGSASNYSNNEDYVLTICPDQAGDKIQLTFTEFSTEAVFDILSIYNGVNTSSPILGTYSGGGAANLPSVMVASINNNSGCLTIRFVSNGVANTMGWSANISNFTPCQDIISQLDSSTPVANTEGNIQVCTGDSITLNGSGVFEIDGAGATYEWDLGNGTTQAGQTVTFSYDTPGFYIVNLNIRDTNTDSNPLGCSNTNSINQVINVSGEPDFTGTQATDDTLCFGETTSIEGIVNSVPVVYNCPPPISEETFLPDGSGIAYSTCVTVSCFAPDAVLTSPSQILDICLNMEHSYSGDLDIKIISPSGQEAILFAQASGGVYFGGADNNDNPVPGIGADYCFSMSATTLLENAGTIIAGCCPPADSWTPGTYLPVESFNALVGSPLNGDWCIEILDNIFADNGYIFSWELNFDPSVPMQDFSFTPTIVSESWDSDSTITGVNGNEITVAPMASGLFCYTYRVVDSFGCEYTEEVCINVADQNESPVTYYRDNDNDGYGDSNVFVNECSSVSPIGFVANDLDCDDTNNLINPDAVDALGNGIDENCDGVDGNILGVEEVAINDLKISPNPFKNNITINLPFNMITASLNLSIYDLNGRLVYDENVSGLDGVITVNNLDELENATYFLKISNNLEGVLFIKKLIKI